MDSFISLQWKWKKENENWFVFDMHDRLGHPLKLCTMRSDILWVALTLSIRAIIEWISFHPSANMAPTVEVLKTIIIRLFGWTSTRTTLEVHVLLIVCVFFAFDCLRMYAVNRNTTSGWSAKTRWRTTGLTPLSPEDESEIKCIGVHFTLGMTFRFSCFCYVKYC